MRSASDRRHADEHWVLLDAGLHLVASGGSETSHFARFGRRQGNTTMGYVMRGTWVDEWYNTTASGGRFVRQDSRFRSWVKADGDFLPEAGRYHLYVSWACPWAHRTLIYRALKGLKDAI